MMREKIHEQFQKHFGGSGEFYASAGRINLIGEHTDYNGGFVFPGAIDKGMMAEIRLNGTDRVRLGRFGGVRLQRRGRALCILGQVCVRSMQGDHQEMR